MPTLELEFEVYCSCGAGMCNNSSEGRNYHSQCITVEPCEACLDRAREEARSEGYDEGYTEGNEKGAYEESLKWEEKDEITNDSDG